MRNILSSLTLKTKLLFMMASLCFLSVTSLLFLYGTAERDLMEEVRRHTEEISTAIQISIEQISMSNEGAYLTQLRGLTRLKKKGIKEISVVNNTRDVIASSNPALIGKKLAVKGESFRNIGNLTEYTSTEGGQKIYDILLPVVVGKDRLGYIHISTQFDDFAAVARRNHRNRLIATLAIFSIGILAAGYLSKKYAAPVLNIAQAAHRVAGGDLSVRLEVTGDDEIGKLTQNFNDMVRKLNDNRELESRLKEAEHMSKIGTLASGIAHEVRNPLNFINLSIDHLRSIHTPGDPAARETFLASIAGIKSEIERLDGMVSNFLNFGRPLKLDLKKMMLEPVIQETLALVAEQCAEQKIKVESMNLSQSASISADYRHIKTCILNILLNAIQAMPEGGTLRVETTVQAGFASVCVEDTGCGIEPEDITRIFEPYFTTKDLGIGLGLPLTKRIIEEHGGRVVVRSAPGKGAAVIIYLPVNPVKRPEGVVEGLRV